MGNGGKRDVDASPINGASIGVLSERSGSRVAICGIRCGVGGCLGEQIHHNVRAGDIKIRGTGKIVVEVEFKTDNVPTNLRRTSAKVGV